MKLFSVSIALSLLLICNACSENDITNDSTTNESKLEIETTIFKTKNTTENSPSALATTEGTPIGAILGNNLPSNSTIGVYVSARPDGFLQYGNNTSGNLRWKNTAGGWLQFDANDQPVPFRMNANPAYLFACYPYIAAASTSSLDIPVKAGYADYMYGKEGNQSGTTNKTLVMNHAMSILSFTFRNKANTGNCMLQGIKLKNMPVNGSMNLITGKVTPATSAGEINLAAYDNSTGYNPQNPDGTAGFSAQYSFKTQSIGTVNPSGTSYAEKMGMFHAIVIPSDSPGNYQVDIKVDGKTKTILFSAANNSTIWEAGKRYIYNIALGYDGTPTIQLDAIISDYEDKGNIEEVFGNNVTIQIPYGVNYINRPTWKNENRWSKSFEVSKTELNNLDWYNATGLTYNNITQDTGCQNYSEQDGLKNWRIPTYKEMQAIISAQNNQIGPKPILGNYWTSEGKASISIYSNTYSVTLSSKEDNSNRLKVRCIRDTYWLNN